MMYRVELSVEFTGWIEVEADDEDAARVKAALANYNFSPSAIDIEDYDFDPFPEIGLGIVEPLESPALPPQGGWTKEGKGF